MENNNTNNIEPSDNEAVIVKDKVLDIPKESTTMSSEQFDDVDDNEDNNNNNSNNNTNTNNNNKTSKEDIESNDDKKDMYDRHSISSVYIDKKSKIIGKTSGDDEYIEEMNNVKYNGSSVDNMKYQEFTTNASLLTDELKNKNMIEIENLRSLENKGIDIKEELKILESKTPSDYLDKDVSNTIRDNLSATPHATVRNVYNDKLNNGSHVNSITLGEKDLNIKHANLTVDKVLNNNRIAIELLKAHMGIGTPVQIPLWHSGFWVTIKAPTIREISILETELASEQIEMGRISSGLIYSNYNVIFLRILFNFFKKLLISTSLKGGLTEFDILDHISVQDIYPIMLGILSGIYPDGIRYRTSCVNTYEIDIKKETTKCSHSLIATLDPKKLLWVDKKVLTSNMLEHMALRGSNKVSLEQVSEYKATLKERLNFEVKKNIISENGLNIVFTLDIPSVSKYIDEGDKWCSRVTKETEELFTDTDTATEKADKLFNVINSIVLGIYGSWVTKIKYNITDDKVISIDNISDVKYALDELSADSELFTSLTKAISELIESSSVSVVGIPSYTCPVCSKLNNQNEKSRNSFNKIIPINVLEPFFVLTAAKIESIAKRDIL